MNRTMPIHRAVVLFCIALSGCASYEPRPLPRAPASTTPLAQLVVDARSLPFPALAAHRFDPSDGLDATEVAVVAVVNNPDLRLARDDAAVAHAQAFAAGLLPDPQLALSGDLSNSGAAGATRAFSLGLSYDINALVLRATTKGAATAEARKTDLALLWQEWQTIAKARLLFVKLIYARKLSSVLQENRNLFADRVVRMKSALQRGLVTNDALAPNVTALQEVERQLFELARQTAQNARDLDALLGLDANVTVPLQGGIEAPWDGQVSVAAALADLPRRRPDLLALQAGYAAQDQRYRGAVLAQFPTLNVGLTRTRDSSNVYSKSVGITLTLPFFNRNRGSIAIEKATRAKLYDEYQQRLQASRNEIDGILAQQSLDREQLAQVDAAVAELSSALARSDLAHRAGNIDALLYANTRGALLAKQVEQINLEQAAAEQRVALQTVLGIDPSSRSSGSSSK